MKKIISLALALTLCATLAACGASQPAPAAASQEAAPAASEAPASTAPASSGEDITQVKTDFKFITAASDANRTAVFDYTIAKLKEKYPNVEFANDSGEDYNNRAKLAFSSGDGYSLILTDDLGITALRDGDYLLDLSQYVKERSWADKQLSGATEFYNLRSPGKSYSVGMNYAPVTIYYNKDIFTELGLQIPTTLAEFENCLKVATEKGYIGSENCKDNITAWYLESLVQNKAPFQDVLNWYYGQESSDNIKKAFIDSAAIIKSWSDKGYFRKDYIGIDGGDVPALFGQGKSAMSLDGNWMLSAYEDTGLNVGTFALPSVDDNKTPNYIINPVDAAWAIGKQVNPTQLAVALDFIDMMMTPELGEKWLAVGSLPSVKADYSKSDTSPLTKELLKAIENTESGFYLDNVKPGFLEVLVKNTQLLMLGEQTPEQMWDAFDAAWNSK